MALVSSWTGTEIDVRLRRGAGGVVRVDGVLCRAPVWFRWDGDTLWHVGSGATPVGEDHVRVRVDIGPGVAVRMRSVAATVVYAARSEGTRWDTEIHVGAGASLDWRPEPVIATARCRHTARTTVHAASSATVVLDEVLVLGRADERSGTIRSTLAVDVDDAPVLRTGIDTALPGWAGAAGTGGARVLGQRLVLGTTADATGHDHAGSDDTGRVARLAPAPGCALALAVGDDVTDTMAAVDRALRG